MVDVDQDKLVISSALAFTDLSRIARQALDQQTFEGVAVRLLSSNGSTDRYRFGAASSAPVLALASLKSGDVSFAEDGSFLAGSAGRLGQNRDGIFTMLAFLWKGRKLSRAMAQFPAAKAALQRAVAEADPSATFRNNY